MSIPLTQDEEILQRLRRIETKIHKFGIRLGLEPAATTLSIVAEEFRDRVVVSVPGYDVTLSQIRRALEQQGVSSDKMLFIVEEDALLATIKLTAHE